MIPTRLHQPFNNGVVLGFNRESGSVIVASKCYYHIDEFDLTTISYKIKQTEQSSTGYTWPSILDLETVAVEIANMISFLRSAHLVNICLVTKTVVVDSEGDLKMSQLFLNNRDNQTSIARDNYGSNSCYGDLIPMMHINGENCDTY